MTELLLAFVIIGTLIALMAIGVLMGRSPIKGTCGGMSALGMDTACDICGGDQNKCDEEQQKQTADKAMASALAYDAAKANNATPKQ